MKQSGRAVTFFVNHLEAIIDGPNGHAIICTTNGEGCEVRETRAALLKRIDVSDADIPN
jgi:hypothetical protein